MKSNYKVGDKVPIVITHKDTIDSNWGNIHDCALARGMKRALRVESVSVATGTYGDMAVNNKEGLEIETWELANGREFDKDKYDELESNPGKRFTGSIIRIK